LLTNKPVLYVCNVDENSIKTETNGLVKLKKWLKMKGEVVVLAAQIEADINELETYEERKFSLKNLVRTE
jgi:ribosome-binding ATPase YchF (GTP1/OBG family)